MEGKETNEEKFNRSGSRLTLRKSFFDDLWPYILWDNVCDLHTKHTTDFFVPLQRFDAVWSHALLAEKGYRNYQAPTELRCNFDHKDKSKRKANIPCSCNIDDDDDDGDCEGVRDLSSTSSREQQQHEKNRADPCSAYVVPLNEQIDTLSNEFDQRRRLAYAFINRQYPWFMKLPKYETDFLITNDMREKCSNTFEFELLQQISEYKCKLMIIDLSARVCMHELERWMKFCNYVFIIVVVRSEEAMRKIRAMGEGFSSVWCVEDTENVWQEQLTADLDMGMTHAMSLGLMEQCSKLVLFLFSHHRHVDTIDTFRIVRRT